MGRISCFFFSRKPSELALRDLCSPKRYSVCCTLADSMESWENIQQVFLVDLGTNGFQGASKKWTAIPFNIQFTFFHYLMKTKLNLKSLPFQRVLFDLWFVRFLRNLHIRQMVSNKSATFPTEKLSMEFFCLPEGRQKSIQASHWFRNMNAKIHRKRAEDRIIETQNCFSWKRPLRASIPTVNPVQGVWYSKNRSYH